uniref:recombinase family protein n=1 Tax=Enterobacter cloacae complex sp. TaxID=2027919 RepID=UPI003B68291D
MVARVYLRVSTDAQDLERQRRSLRPRRPPATTSPASTVKASGARADRPELLRMIGDLQPGEVVIAEKIDRISRLPLPEAERLVASIQAKGASWPSLAWSIYPTWRPRPGRRQDRAGSRADHAFSPGLADGPRRLRGQARTPAPRH